MMSQQMKNWEEVVLCRCASSVSINNNISTSAVVFLYLFSYTKRIVQWKEEKEGDSEVLK